MKDKKASKIKAEHEGQAQEQPKHICKSCGYRCYYETAKYCTVCGKKF